MVWRGVNKSEAKHSSTGASAEQNSVKARTLCLSLNTSPLSLGVLPACVLTARTAGGCTEQYETEGSPVLLAVARAAVWAGGVKSMVSEIVGKSLRCSETSRWVVQGRSRGVEGKLEKMSETGCEDREKKII